LNKIANLLLCDALKLKRRTRASRRTVWEPWVYWLRTLLHWCDNIREIIVKSLRGTALKEDTVQWNRTTITDANGLLSVVETRSFLVTLANGCNVLNQWFSIWGSRTPRGSREDFQGYLDDSWVFKYCYFLTSYTRGKCVPIAHSVQILPDLALLQPTGGLVW